MYYLSLDGGGTKLSAIVFDEKYHLIACARSKGTHRAVYSESQIKENIKDCYNQLFSNIQKPIHIEKMYIVCGPDDLFMSLLPFDITVGEVCELGEAVSGLYAGALRKDGFVVLSGTGSDVFFIKNSKLIRMLGGWGAVLGDEGSGVWMSKKAVEAAIRYYEDWGEYTAFLSVLEEHYKFSDLLDYIKYLYNSPSPFRTLGELLPLVAETANKGDEAMLEVLHLGGEMLGVQMTALLRKYPDEKPNITACGGAWKAHSLIAEAFIETVKKEFPEAKFSLPMFEHIIAAPVALAFEKGENRDAILPVLKENFKDYIWNCK